MHAAAATSTHAYQTLLSSNHQSINNTAQWVHFALALLTATPLMLMSTPRKIQSLLLLSAGLAHSCGRRVPAANGAFNVPVPEAQLIVRACEPH